MEVGTFASHTHTHTCASQSSGDTGLCHRKVRMQKDFVNKEPLSQGGFKLKIPSTLVQDKKKTRQRAMVIAPLVHAPCWSQSEPCDGRTLHLSIGTSIYTQALLHTRVYTHVHAHARTLVPSQSAPRHAACLRVSLQEMKRKFSKASGHCALPPRPQHRAQARPVADRPGADGAAPSAQRSRGATGPAEGRFQQHPGVRQEKRSVSTVCKRVYHLVTNVVVPLSHHIQRLPSKTVFVCNNEDFMQKIFERMCTESPSLLRMEKGKFLTGMGGIFDKYQNESLCPSPSPRGTEQRN